MVFQHDDWVGGEVFTLEAERLVITAKALGTKSEKIVRLTNLSPECDVTRRRIGILYGVPLFLIGVCCFATWKIGRSFDDSRQMFLVLPAVMIPGFIFYAVRGYQPLEVTRFCDKSGSMVFELIETKRKRFEYADFIAELKKRIAQRSWS